jgi:hypothetical protein
MQFQQIMHCHIKGLKNYGALLRYKMAEFDIQQQVRVRNSLKQIT